VGRTLRFAVEKLWWSPSQRPGYTLRAGPVETPTQGQGRERAELDTRLPPLIAASFFTWSKAAQALGYPE